MLATRIVISVTVLVYFLSVYRRNFGSFFLFFPVNYIARALYLGAIPDERAWFLSSPYFLVEARYYYTTAVKGHRALIRIIVAI
jgi:hypothetical protein